MRHHGTCKDSPKAGGAMRPTIALPKVTDARLDHAELNDADFSPSLLRNVSAEGARTAGAIDFML